MQDQSALDVVAKLNRELEELVDDATALDLFAACSLAYECDGAHEVIMWRDWPIWTSANEERKVDPATDRLQPLEDFVRAELRRVAVPALQLLTRIASTPRTPPPLRLARRGS